jgi:hypothetical protein
VSYPLESTRNRDESERSRKGGNQVVRRRPGAGLLLHAVAADELLRAAVQPLVSVVRDPSSLTRSKEKRQDEVSPGATLPPTERSPFEPNGG